MACDMCSPGGRVRRAAAELLDGGTGRPCGEDAMAYLTEGGTIRIETGVPTGRGGRYVVELAADYCPWCGARLGDETDWRGLDALLGLEERHG